MSSYPPVAREHLYASPTRQQQASVLLKLLLLPLLLMYTICQCVLYFHPKKWKRAFAETIFRYLATNLKIRQLQWLFGTSRDMYVRWARGCGVRVRIDLLEGEEGGRLFWIGERTGKGEKVVLYFHGEGFLLPIPGHALAFWHDLQLQLEPKGKPFGIVCLDYSLLPTAPFPTPLIQAVRAIQHLLSHGIAPADIHLAGEAAGANLVLQVVSHLLHPITSVPELQLTPNAPNVGSHAGSRKLGGIYLLSPWVSLLPTSFEVSQRRANQSSDVLTSRVLSSWGAHAVSAVLPCQRSSDSIHSIHSNDSAPSTQSSSYLRVPEHMQPYLEPSKAPAGWFAALDTVAKRVFVNGGAKECMADEIRAFYERLQREVLAEVNEGLADVDEHANSGAVAESSVEDDVDRRLEIREGKKRAFDDGHAQAPERDGQRSDAGRGKLTQRPRRVEHRQKRLELRYHAQPGGAHVDPYLDFIFPMGVRQRAKIGWVVRGWLETGMA